MASAPPRRGGEEVQVAEALPAMGLTCPGCGGEIFCTIPVIGSRLRLPHGVECRDCGTQCDLDVRYLRALLPGVFDRP